MKAPIFYIKTLLIIVSSVPFCLGQGQPGEDGPPYYGLELPEYPMTKEKLERFKKDLEEAKQSQPDYVPPQPAHQGPTKERTESNQYDVTIVISRTFDTDFEKELILKAESIYPNSKEVIELIHKTIDPKIEKAKKYSNSTEYKDGKLLRLYQEWKTEALNEENPWWFTKIEGIKIPYTITDQAIESLRDYCEGLRESNSQQENTKFWMRGRMFYSAKISKHKQHYASQEDRTFFIVEMRLRYNREGWGFTFEREVIFDDKGELILWTRDGTITVT